MRNREVAQKFIAGETTEDKIEGSNMFIEGRIIYSYGHHFPIAIRLKNNVFLFNSSGYSPSTERHKSYVLNAIKNAGYQILFFNTGQLLEIKDELVQELKEVMLHKFEKSNGGRIR